MGQPSVGTLSSYWKRLECQAPSAARENLPPNQKTEGETQAGRILAGAAHRHCAGRAPTYMGSIDLD